MLKKILITSITYLFLTINVFGAGSSGGDGGSTKIKTNYEKAVSHIEIAKKFEKKGKLEKAKKRYAKAQKFLIKSNNKKPNKADTLNYLGFTTRKLGDKFVFENLDKVFQIILKAATYELLYKPNTPINIIIKEYLNSSNFFLEESQTKYLNALLDNIGKKLRTSNARI